jgi:two-component system response regulator YesN
MPGIDGISAISEIKGFLPEIEFLVISAHTDFEFAQPAIKLGAAAYLTKPLKNGELISALNILYDKIADVRAKKELNRNLNKIIKTLKPQVEDNILHAIASMHITGDVSDQFSQFWDTNVNQYFYIFTVQSHGQRLAFDKQETLTNHVRKNLRAICPEFIMGFINGEFLTLLPFQPDKINDELEVYQREIIDYLQTCFYDTQFHAQIVVSDVVSDLQSLAEEYRKFQKKAFLKNNSTAFRAKSIKSELYTHVLTLCEKITSGDTKSSVHELNTVISFIKTESRGNPDEECNYLKDIHTIIKGFILSNKDTFDLFSDFFGDLQIRIENIQDAGKLSDEIMNMVINCADHYEKKYLLNVDSKINGIIEYINNNYTVDNSLESLAKKYNLNVSYLSKTFKQRYGKNFIDFVTELRIEQAKKLLTTTNKSIKEITYAVGYNSQTYFCKVFKKNVGISASEYKQGHALV